MADFLYLNLKLLTISKIILDVEASDEKKDFKRLLPRKSNKRYISDSIWTYDLETENLFTCDDYPFEPCRNKSIPKDKIFTRL